MTTYFKDFSDELTTGVFPSDFTERWDTGTATPTVEASSGAEDARAFEIDVGADYYLASWDDIDGDANRDECELVVRWRQTVDDDNVVWLVARASGTTTTEGAYVLLVNSGSLLAIGRISAGTFTTLEQTVDMDQPDSPVFYQSSGKQIPGTFTFVPTGHWMWMRFRVNGVGATVTLSAKVWMDGTEEPTDWSCQTTDVTGSRITAAGWVGLGRDNTTGVGIVDYLGVGTAGNTAPITVSTNTPVRLSAIWVEVALSSDDPALRVYNVLREVMHSANNSTALVTQAGIQVVHEFPAAAGGGDVLGQLVVTT